MIVAKETAQKRLKQEPEVEQLKDAFTQLWSLSRPGVLLLSGWLGKRAILLLPGALAGVPEALLGAFIVFALFVAWERLGSRLGERVAQAN